MTLALTGHAVGRGIAIGRSHLAEGSELEIGEYRIAADEVAPDALAPDDLAPDYVPGDERIVAGRPDDEPDDDQVEPPPVPAKPRKGKKHH